MLYEKQNFVDDQALSAEQLNHMEEGIRMACAAAPPTCTTEGPVKVLGCDVNGYVWVDAAYIDDNAVGENAWSSRAIVQRLCPPFTESGATVTCFPVAGYPLSVVSRIDPAQAGAGTPTTENVRPIIGVSTVTLTHNEAPVVLDLGQTVYGGSYNWQTGELTVDRGVLALTGKEKWRYTALSNGYVRIQCSVSRIFTKETLVCSHYPMHSNYSSNYKFPFMRANDNSSVLTYEAAPGEGDFVSVEDFQAYLEAQYAAGMPVQVVYRFNNPQTYSLTPKEILALSGANVLHSDTGNTTVTGRTDPLSIIADLQETQKSLLDRVIALESVAINNT